MPPNGTCLPPFSLPSPSPSPPRRKRSHSESALDPATPITLDLTALRKQNPPHHGSKTHASDFPPQGRPSASYVQHPLGHVNGAQMQQPRGAQPSWDPKLLLSPRSNSAPVSPAGQQLPEPTRRHVGTAATPVNQVFQFSSPTVDLTELDGAPAAPVGQTQPPPAANGFGSMIERINNVESRQALPQPKRRKVDGAELASGPDAAARRGGSGMLTGYVKQDNKADVAEGLTPMNVSQTVDLTDHIEGDAAAVSPELQEVCYGMLDMAQVNCHSVPTPRPGTIALGGAGYWPPIKTVLKRRVGDPTTAVFVYDHTREIFGKLDRKTAGALARLLDAPSVQLRTDSRIPSRRRQPDEVVGQPTSRAYKMEITLYGRRKLARGVGKVLRENGLRLLNPSIVPRGMTVCNPHAQDLVQTHAPKPANPQVSYTPAAMQRTVEEVRSDVLGVFDSLSKSEDLPHMEPGPLVLTELLPHQKQGLYFMTARENPDGSAAQSKHIGSLWKMRQVHGGHVEYLNLVTQQSESVRPKETLGGILADMMGLGKTLSILSLVASSLGDAKAWADRDPDQPLMHEKKKPSSSSRFNAPTPEPLGLTRLSRNAKTTLLVCPLSTITNWEEQIKQHIKPGALTYHIYHGQNRIKDPAQLAEFDLVLTTYGSVSSELTARNKRKTKQLPLEEIGWFRIVLDEAHMIREQSTLQFKAICRLQANRRWAVTGTPVQNRLDDLAALLAFLRLKPFDDRNRFNQHIVMPFKMADPEIIPKLRLLVDTITLRRLKDKIHLPPRTDEVIKLKFSPEEQRLYDMFAKNAKDRVQALTGSRERILGGKTYIHILQSILRLRLICAHGADLLSDEDLKAVEGMTQESAIDLDSDDEADRPALPDEKAYSMFDLMKETNSDTCVMCQRKLGSNDTADIESERQEDVIGFMTPCFHLYCPKCIKHWRDEEQGLPYNSNKAGGCPICRQMVRFTATELRRTRVEAEHEDAFRSSAVAGARGRGRGKKPENYNGPHTKTKALVSALLATREESELMPDEPPIKSVVFSGWTSHLDLIEIALDEAGIKHTRLDGKMTRTARTQAMDLFRDDPSVHVILVSIMAGGLGLNLTAGSRVYVMEPQYNPAAEAQAVDRVHRLGQKRAVRTVRYIMESSFEEQMVALQEKKIKLANLSMDRNSDVATMDKREAARQRLIDLKDLFK